MILSRRHALLGLAASPVASVTAAVSVTEPAFAEHLHPDAATPLLAKLVHAIEAETAAYRAAAIANSLDADDLAEAASGVVMDVHAEVLALPVSASRDYQIALALYRRWIFVSENLYADPNHRTECRLVDTVLAGTPYDHLPMLWHLNGKPWPRRPTEDEFARARAERAECDSKPTIASKGALS
jgi:hypothetical protein